MIPPQLCPELRSACALPARSVRTQTRTHHGTAGGQPPAEAQELASKQQASQGAGRAAGSGLVAAYYSGGDGEECEEDDHQQGQANGHGGEVGAPLQGVGGVLQLALVEDGVQVRVVGWVVVDGRGRQVPAGADAEADQPVARQNACSSEDARASSS